jgi:hypothetical protein
VDCLTCKEDVIAVVVPFGRGYVGTCPLCGNLAYNAQEKPPEMKNLQDVIGGKRQKDIDVKEKLRQKAQEK